MTDSARPEADPLARDVAAAVEARRARRYDVALEAYDRALALAPDDAELHSARGDVLRFLRRFGEAERAYDEAIAIDPGAAVAHMNRGFALYRQNRHNEALASFDQAIALQPDLAMAHNGRGSVLFDEDRSEEALASFDRAAAIAPDLAEAHLNRAVTLRKLARFEEAAPAYDRAIALKPAFSDAYYFRSLCLLTLGRYEAGWRDHERRWDTPSFLAEGASEVPAQIRARFEPAFTRQDLTGARVLLSGEQGVGDVLMFASMLPDLLAVAQSVDLVCDARLHRLFRASFPGLRLPDAATAVERLAEYDRVAPIGSLGRLFRNRIEDFPGKPYLAPGPEARARWADRLGPADGRRRIGVAWRGGRARTGAGARSMDLAALAPLFKLPGCEFVSLQYGAVDAEVAEAGPGLATSLRVFPTAEIDDFQDLSALVQNLDLVVSVQQTLVHLSGAVGAPALVMIPPAPEWRYTASSSTMPWYGSVRLFRRRHDEDWSRVVVEVAEAAAAHLGLQTSGT